MSLKLDQKSLENQNLDKNVIVLEPRNCYVRRHDEQVVNHLGNMLAGSLNKRQPHPLDN